MKVLFDKLANLELDDASEYYEFEVPGLGVRFKEEVKRGIRRICEYPGTWAIEKGDVRRYLLHMFPYTLEQALLPLSVSRIYTRTCS
jgi:hypothetical protein